MDGPEKRTAARERLVARRSEPEVLVSIVVPALNEAENLPRLLSDLRALPVPYEVIVADGGSGDDTVGAARRAGARVVRARPGRGPQLRAGAAAARAPLLCFLHADVRLPPAAVETLSALALARPPGAHAFRLRIDAAGAAYRLIEAGANLRSRLLGLPYGDQGLVIRRDDYESVGGYPDVVLMEDVALVRALRGRVKLSLLGAPLIVSARRWRHEGPIRRTLSNWVLLARFLAGFRSEPALARYRPEPPPG